MINFLAAAELFAAAVGDEGASQLVADGELLESLKNEFFPTDKPPNWRGLANSPKFQEGLAAAQRQLTEAVNLSRNKLSAEDIVELISSIG